MFRRMKQKQLSIKRIFTYSLTSLPILSLFPFFAVLFQ